MANAIALSNRVTGELKDLILWRAEKEPPNCHLWGTYFFNWLIKALKSIFCTHATDNSVIWIKEHVTAENNMTVVWQTFWIQEKQTAQKRGKGFTPSVLKGGRQVLWQVELWTSSTNILLFDNQINKCLV